MLYEVTLKAVCVVAVEAESAEKATEIATDEAYCGDYVFEEGGPAVLVADDERDAVLRHADMVVDDDAS